jgi:hypothetical protein
MRSAWLPVAAAAMLLGGCGTATSTPQTEDQPTDSPAERPTTVLAADGPVRTAHGATVIDEGDGPQACMGGVAGSYPPQCQGVPLAGWSWDGVPGDYEEASGVRWGTFVVTGTFDGTTLTVTDVAGPEAADPQPPHPDFGSPCPVPESGWQVIDRELTTERTLTQTINAAERRDDFAAAWVDQSINPVYPQVEAGEMGIDIETRMNDPEFTIINIQVTGDVAAAEAEARQTWGGSLCVSKGRSSQRERQRIQEELNTLPGMVSSSGGGVEGVVELEVVYDDGSLQKWADATYGEGLVEVTSALRPVG